MRNIYYHRCPSCNFVSSDINLSCLSTPCPNCGKTGESRELFPDMSSIKIAKMINEYYEKREEIIRTTIIKEIQKYSKETRTKKIQETLKAINDIFKRKDIEQASPEAKKVIKTELGVDDKDIDNVLFISMTYGSTDEDKIITILSCVLFECILKEFLLSCLIFKNCPRKLAETFIFEQRYNTSDLISLFKTLIGKKFSRYVSSKSGYKGFYREWECIRDRRNLFMHGNAYSIDSVCGDKAFNFSSKVMPLFAMLNNDFFVKKK